MIYLDDSCIYENEKSTAQLDYDEIEDTGEDEQ